MIWRIAFLFTLCVSQVALANAPKHCAALLGDDVTLPGELISDTGWAQVRLPDKGDVSDTLALLDTDAIPLVLAIELNGDSDPELLLTSPDGRLCGNAGCPYHLISNATYARIGSFFGRLAVHDERINGYRLIQTYSRFSPVTTRIDTYAFDRGQYRLVAHQILDECGFAHWQEHLRRRQR